VGGNRTYEKKGTYREKVDTTDKGCPTITDKKMGGWTKLLPIAVKVASSFARDVWKDTTWPGVSNAQEKSVTNPPLA